MDTKLLTTFIAVIEERSFSRAADRLGVAQPVVSRRIQRLEADLGARLLERSSSSVSPTAAGSALYERGRDLLLSTKDMREAVHQAAEGTTGNLRLGFVGSAGFRVLPEIIRAFRIQALDVRLGLTELTTSEQLSALEHNQIDAGLARPPILSGDLESRIVWRERFVVALPESHPLSDSSGVSIADLRDDRFVIFPRHLGPGYHDLVVGICRRAGFTLEIAQEAIQMPTIVGFVGAGLGVALVPETVADFQLQGVTFRPIDDRETLSEMALIWNPSNQSPVLKRFIGVAVG